MRYVTGLLLLAFSLIAAIVVTEVAVDGELSVLSGLQAAELPPLKVDRSAPLLLLDEPAEKPELKSPHGGPVADNSACYVCHGNYDGEELVVAHGKEGTGCIDCHGESIEHRNDEDNITPPDQMYALEDVDSMCADCHDMHDAPARKVIERWQERCPAKTDPKEIVCTDCHFQHRLPFRTVWWDKETGELVVRKEGERTKPAADLSAPGEVDSE